MFCPVCAAGMTSWLLAGSLGTSGAAVATLHWRRKKSTPLKRETSEKQPMPGVNQH